MPTSWLIGGPSRCGKTTLVNVAEKYSSSHVALPVEALFVVFYYRWYPFARSCANLILSDYLGRERYTNAERTAAKKPIDSFKRDLSETVTTVLERSSGSHQLSQIASALDVMAEDQDKKGWVACDLNPEYLYPRMRKRMPGVGLIIMLRDPREAIAAALYWRDWPRGAALREPIFRHRLVVWCLSALTAFQHKKQFRGDVQIGNFNKTFLGRGTVGDDLQDVLNIPADALRSEFNNLPFFSVNSEGWFLGYDNQWHQLLTDEELAVVEAIAAPWMKKLGYAPIVSQRAGAPAISRGFVKERFIIGIGKYFPETAKIICDFMYFPKTFLRRRFNIVLSNLKIIVRMTGVHSMMRQDMSK